MLAKYMKFVLVATLSASVIGCTNQFTITARDNLTKKDYCSKIEGISKSAKVYYPVELEKSERYRDIARKAVNSKYTDSPLEGLPKPSVWMCCSDENEIRVLWRLLKQPIFEHGGIDIERSVEVEMTKSGLITSITRTK